MGAITSQINRLLRRRSKKTSKLRVIGLCEGNSPVTGEFPAQMASNAENVPFDDVTMVVDFCSNNLAVVKGNNLWLSGAPCPSRVDVVPLK